MLGNDLSNAAPRRVLVHVSAVFMSEVHLKKWWLFTHAETELTPDLRVLNRLCRAWDRGGLVFDLFRYSGDGYPAEEMFELLDGVSHPFRDLQTFRDYAHLSEFCAYTPDVIEVMDPQHPLGFSRSVIL